MGKVIGTIKRSYYEIEVLNINDNFIEYKIKDEPNIKKSKIRNYNGDKKQYKYFIAQNEKIKLSKIEWIK